MFAGAAQLMELFIVMLLQSLVIVRQCQSCFVSTDPIISQHSSNALSNAFKVFFFNKSMKALLFKNSRKNIFEKTHQSMLQTQTRHKQ